MRPVVVGLTGGLGSGKSTVASRLRRAGVRVLDADAVVHAALRPGGAAYRRVRRLFGPAVLGPGGRLDRRRVAARVFREPALRKRLEGILHPLVVRFFRREIAARRRGLLVLDVPLLFETGLDRLTDYTVVVWAPWKIRRARVVKSGRMSAADARRRERAQLSLAEKKRRADLVIDNSGSLSRLGEQVRRIFDLNR